MFLCSPNHCRPKVSEEYERSMADNLWQNSERCLLIDASEQESIWN